MSQTDNLIDFNNSKSLTDPAEKESVSKCCILTPENTFIGLEKSNDTINSSDNNPFDTALEQMNLQDDPFEIVMQQAEDQKIASCHRLEVQTEDLLGLNEDFSGITVKEKEIAKHQDSPINPNLESIDLNGFSLSPILKDNGTRNAETTSKPIGRSTNSGAHSNDIRTQLLKLSVSSSPAESPPLRRNSKTSDDSIESINGKRESQKLNCYEFNDSCDDINALRPNWVDSETEQDSDLELLSIPILQQMDKDAETLLIASTKNKDSEEKLARHSQKTNENDLMNKSSHAIDLQMIRDRVRRHKLGKNNSQDVGDIINSMKDILLECENKKQKNEATRLLDSLSALFSEIKEDTERNEVQLAEEQDKVQDKTSTDVEPDVPQPIVRQGTFDLDKSHKSATFVNDVKESSVQDDEDSSSNSNQNASQLVIAPGVSSIVEQIGMLLGNQNINVLQTNIGASDSTTTNPTYIVVMGAPNNYAPYTPVRQNTQILETSTASPEFAQQARNRSHSLSLHDKPTKSRVITTPSSPTVFNTPTRPNTLKRRSTISFSPSTASQLSSRKSLCNPPGAQKPVTLQRRQSLNSDRDIASQRVSLKNIPHVKTDSNARSMKLKSSENTQRKVGPLKATIPIRNVLPTIVTSSEGSSKIKLMSMPIAPVACSTPSAISPDTVRNKFRPPVSVTPKPKTSMKSNLSGVYRRRSLTDSKSPKRCNTTGLTNRMSTGLHQFVRKSGLNFSAKNFGHVQPKNKENNPPK